MLRNPRPAAGMQDAVPAAAGFVTQHFDDNRASHLIFSYYISYDYLQLDIHCT